MFQRSLTQVVLLVLAMALVATGRGSAQPAFQVADIVTGPTAAPLSPFGQRFSVRTFAEADGTVFFSADDGLHGSELWRSDGTEAGTVLVKDLCPGICSSSPDNLAVVGEEVYFSTSSLGIWRSDGTAEGTVQISGVRAWDLIEMEGELLFTSSHALWKSDGTAAGTVLVQSFPEAFVPVFLGQVGDLTFLLIESSVVGREVWKTDGTAAGTVLLKDINPGLGSSLHFTNSSRFPVLGGRLFFPAFSPQTGSTLWVTDGTAAGTHAVPNATYPNEMIVRGDEIFFTGWNGIWKTDGTNAQMLYSFDPLRPPEGLTLAGNLIYFSAWDSSFGQEIWKTDGTAAGTERVTDLAPGAQDGLSYQHPFFFTGVGDRLVFYTHIGPAGEEPWATDGTAAGTALLGDLNPGPAGSLRSEYSRSDGGIVSEGRWFFGAYTHPTGWALWTTDGTAAGTQLVRPFEMWSSLRKPLFTDHADTLFMALEEGFQGAALWKSDGSTAGTNRLKFIGGGLYGEGDMFSWNGHVYSNAAGLWQSDGTEAGTLNISSWAPGPTLFLTPTESGLFLLEHSSLFPNHAIALWKTDGTLPGTQRLADFEYAVDRPAAFRNGVALTGTDFWSRSDLWLSDGTAAGTSPLSLSAGLDPYLPLTAVGDRLFFWASEAGPGSIDYEPWVSDGTLAGTRLLRDIRPGSESSQRRIEDAPVAALGHRWFFLADDGLSGEELWVSDGTTPGTRRVRDIRPGAEPAQIETLVAARDRVWFSADDGAHGRELWMSDGTEAGTRMVRDIVPGAGGSWPHELTEIGHVLLFSAFDPAHGVELWRSDGTEAGTVRMLDIAPGPLPSSPMEITASGPYLYFAANDGTTGFEPWALDRTLLGGFLTATKKVSGRPVPGGTLTYTIVIRNVGAGPHPDHPGDELVDVLPAGLVLVGAGADTGTASVSLGANRVSWNGALPVGGTATVTVEATVGASRGTVLRNRAELSFDANGDGAHEPVATVSAPADALIVSGPLSFYTLPPCRLLDTRSGTPLASGAVRTIAVAGSCGIPADAEAVAANLTVVNPGAPGYVKIRPAGAPPSDAADVSFNTGALRSNNATLSLNGGGAIDLQATLFGASPQTHLVLDVSGYYRTED